MCYTVFEQTVRNIQSARDGVFLVLTPALVHRHHTVTVVSASVELYINVGSLASTLCSQTATGCGVAPCTVGLKCKCVSLLLDKRKLLYLWIMNVFFTCGSNTAAHFHCVQKIIRTTLPFATVMLLQQLRNVCFSNHCMIINCGSFSDSFTVCPYNSSFLFLLHLLGLLLPRWFSSPAYQEVQLEMGAKAKILPISQLYCAADLEQTLHH